MNNSNNKSNDSSGASRKIDESSKYVAKTSEIAVIALLTYLGYGLLNTDGNLVLILSTPIISSLHMTITQYSYVLAGGFIVSFVLGLVFGPLADRIGRKAVLQVTLLGTAVFSVLQYAMQNFLQWFLIRLGAQGFTSGEYGTGATILSEVLPKHIRGWIMGIMQSGWVFGYGLASAIALAAMSLGRSYGPEWWRVAFLFAFLPAILVIFLRTKMPESKRYLHYKELKEAEKRGDTARVEELLKIYKVDLEEAKKTSYRQLFDKGIRRVTWVMAFWWFMTTGVAIVGMAYTPAYFEMFRNMPIGPVTTVFAVASFSGILAYMASGALSDVIGGKWSAAVFVALELLGLYLLVVEPYSTVTPAFWLYYLIFYFGLNGQFAAEIRLTTEAFPTRIRGTGTNWSTAWYAIGQAVLLLVFAQVMNYFIAITHNPLIGFNDAWIWGAIVPEIVSLIIFLVAMPHIRPRLELEEIAV
jgi:MFS family permease